MLEQNVNTQEKHFNAKDFIIEHGLSPCGNWNNETFKTIFNRAAASILTTLDFITKKHGLEFKMTDWQFCNLARCRRGEFRYGRSMLEMSGCLLREKVKTESGVITKYTFFPDKLADYIAQIRYRIKGGGWLKKPRSFYISFLNLFFEKNKEVLTEISSDTKGDQLLSCNEEPVACATENKNEDGCSRPKTMQESLIEHEINIGLIKSDEGKDDYSPHLEKDYVKYRHESNVIGQGLDFNRLLTERAYLLHKHKFAGRTAPIHKMLSNCIKYYHGLNLKVSEAMFIRWIMSEVVDKVDANGMPIYPKDMTGFERSGPVASFAKMFKRIFAPKQPMENLERVTVKCHSTDRRQIVVDNHGPVDIECEILKMRNAIHGGLNA